METSISVYEITLGSRTNGPARRNILHVAGCSIRCTGCFSKHTWETSAGKMTPVSEVAQRLLQRDPEGVSISGGEPLDQAEGLLALLTLLPPLPKGVLMYTGTTEKQREHLPLWGEIRKRVDLLVAGPYVQEKRVWPVTRLLSSSNQVLHYLSDKLGPTDLEGGAQVEVIVGKEIRTLGFPREHDVCNP